ncbi:MAG: 30S ribosomal protein S4 [Minisyncoccia bacterium]
MVKISNKCKICRSLSQKLFLKGDKCYSPKCLMVKRPYPPGVKRKRPTLSKSEYKTQLTEKQKLKYYYMLTETQLKNEIKKILKRRGKVSDVAILFLQSLERRLDNVIFRTNFALSRKHARQLINHGFFKLNEKNINKAGIKVKKGDKITLRESKKTEKLKQLIKMRIKNFNPPQWLKIDKENLIIEVIDDPIIDNQTIPPINLSFIFEFYSR